MINENNQQNKLIEFLQKYSFDDLAKSFLILNLWLPNVASPIKIQYLYVLLESIFKNLSAENKIESYEDFQFICKKLFELLPSFEMLEDYTPEADWGDVKYYFREKFYKVFYGGDLSNSYDFYYAFEIIHEAFEKEYLDLLNRSPFTEMKFCQELQDYILTNLSQNKTETIDNIEPGYIEIPIESFWKSTCEFIEQYRPENHYSSDILVLYSKEYIEMPPFLSMNSFIENAYRGRNCQYFFVKKSNRYYPVMPRKWLTVIYDCWGTLLKENYANIVKKLDKEEPSVLIGINLAKFIRERINKDNVFPLVRSIKSDLKTAHDLIFTAIHSEDKIFLIYVTPPFFDQNELNKHLEEIKPKLKESATLVNQPPTRIGLIAEQKIVEFESTKRKKALVAIFLIVLPSPLSNMQGIIEVPDGICAEIMTLDQAAGIFDEIQKPKDLSDFFDYLSKEKVLGRISAQNSYIDWFGSFKDSHGILVPGAIEYDQIALDPHYGSMFRYSSLKTFWSSFPEVSFFGHPRSWIIPDDRKTVTGLLLDSKKYFGYAYYQKILNASFFINAPVHLMEFEEGVINDSVMHSLFDSIDIYLDIIEKLSFVKAHNKVHIFFCPSSLAQNKDEMVHIRYLVPKNDLWRMDCTYIAFRDYGIRMVYNQEKLVEALNNVKDRSIQIRLLIEIFEQLNTLVSEPNLAYLKSELEKEKGKKARFKTYIINKMVSFPEGIGITLPDQREYKLADKEIAKIALEIGVQPGTYSFDEGKKKANSLRSELVQFVNVKIKDHNLNDAIPILLEKANALVHDSWRVQEEINASLIHEVDYERSIRSSEKETKLIHWYGVFRYLIEKFIQLQPSGTTELNNNSLKKLLALVDCLINLYENSDLIHYGLYPVNVHIDRDYLVSIIIDEKYNIALKEKEYGEEQAKLKLGIIGNQDDIVNSSLPKKDYLDELDCAFKQDFNFGLKNLIKLQQVLALWADNDKKKEKTYYYATTEEISSICSQRIKSYKASETVDILNFLTLNPKEMLIIKGDPQAAEDIPIWEHNKRLMRFDIRPLLKIGEQYFWGPHSIRRSSQIWGSIIKKHRLPSDINAPTVKKLLREGYEALTSRLVEKIMEIALRYSNLVARDVYLHKYDDKLNDIGDFDVFAYLKDKNILLNIESKIIDSPHCAKDSGRLQRKIFGELKEGKIIKKGYLQQVEERAIYLKNKGKGKDMINKMDWGTPMLNPKVVSIFVTKIGFWWTKYPPIDTEVKFVEIRLLDDFIRNL